MKEIPADRKCVESGGFTSNTVILHFRCFSAMALEIVNPTKPVPPDTRIFARTGASTAIVGEFLKHS